MVSHHLDQFYPVRSQLFNCFKTPVKFDVNLSTAAIGPRAAVIVVGNQTTTAFLPATEVKYFENDSFYRWSHPRPNYIKLGSNENGNVIKFHYQTSESVLNNEDLQVVDAEFESKANSEWYAMKCYSPKMQDPISRPKPETYVEYACYEKEASGKPGQLLVTAKLGIPDHAVLENAANKGQILEQLATYGPINSTNSFVDSNDVHWTPVPGPHWTFNFDTKTKLTSLEASLENFDGEQLKWTKKLICNKK